MSVDGLDKKGGEEERSSGESPSIQMHALLIFVNTVPLLSSFSVNVAFLFVRFFVSRISSI